MTHIDGIAHFHSKLPTHEFQFDFTCLGSHTEMKVAPPMFARYIIENVVYCILLKHNICYIYIYIYIYIYNILYTLDIYRVRHKNSPEHKSESLYLQENKLFAYNFNINFHYARYR